MNSFPVPKRVETAWKCLWPPATCWLPKNDPFKILSKRSKIIKTKSLTFRRRHRRVPSPDSSKKHSRAC